MNLTGKNLIGKEPSSSGSNTFQAFNPASQTKLEVSFSEATIQEVSQAVEKAEKAFQVYRQKSPAEIASFLEAIADEILNLGDALIERCSAETALPAARLTGERARTMNQLKLFASVVREGSWIDARIDTALPDREPLPKPDIRQMQIAMGPVGIFGASNFPLAFSVAGGDTASALAAGCTIVVKAHPLHPGTSEMVGQAVLTAAEKTGMPDGVFSLLQGTTNDVGMAIVEHPKITAIGFTGSFKGGKALFDAANLRSVPIPVYSEMGSINPVFVLPGAMKNGKDKIAQGLVNSVNLGVGQFCTNPGLVITQKSTDNDEFLQKVGELAGQSAAGVMLSDQIKQGYAAGVQKFQGISGVKVLAQGQSDDSGNKGRTVVFSADSETFLSNSELTEEVFGPATLNVTASHKEEMIKLAESLDGHLTATIQGTEADLMEYADLIKVLERKVGRIIFNGFPTGVEVCHSMVHGGPYPATTAPQTTSVGTLAIKRFSRPVCYQDFPQAALPEQLKDGNPLSIWRMKNGEIGKE